MAEKIYLIVDGSQAAPNIRHALLGVGFPKSSIIEIEQSRPDLFDVIKKDVDDGSCKGVIVSGSPRSVYDADATHLDRRIYDLNVKKLLICYALHDAAYQLGGKVQKAARRENGTELLTATGSNPFFNYNQSVKVISNHGDEVVSPWPRARVFAKTGNNAIAAVYDAKRNIVAVQPHFEISGEEARRDFFGKFRNWIEFTEHEEFTPETVKKYIFEDLKKNCPLKPGEKVMVALSGGIDSTVTAAAAVEFYGEENVDLVFVDTGLLRYDYAGVPGEFTKETDRLLAQMREQFGAVECIDAKQRFIDALAEADSFDNPETNKGRRQIIGNLFADVFADFARERGNIKYFFQGTNQADKQESGKGRGKSDRIKTHHNEVPYLKEALADAGVLIYEPLHWLYKNNIFDLGPVLNLKAFTVQPPFPGPGMAVRIDGAVNAETLARVCMADAIFRYHVEKAIADGQIGPLEEGFSTRQYFAALLNTATNPNPELSIDGVADRESTALWTRAADVFDGWLMKQKSMPWEQPHIILNNTITTTGQKGDGRLDGYQIEIRLFDSKTRAADIPNRKLRTLAGELLKLREITRVSYALSVPYDAKRAMRDSSGKLSGHIELTSVDTRDFSSLYTTDIPRKVLDEIALDMYRNKVADYITRVIGEKPGMTTERH